MYSAARGFAGQGIPEGAYTSTIYGLIRDRRFKEAINILTAELPSNPKSRAALSLLAYCYYNIGDFVSAAGSYEELLKYYPEVSQYKLNFAQALLKASLYSECIRICNTIDDPELSEKVHKLQALAYYENDDFPAAQKHLEECAADDSEVLLLSASIHFKEEKYDMAQQAFENACNIVGSTPELAYNVALCMFKRKLWSPALKLINDIIERGIREHPELSVGSNVQGVEVRSVGNTKTLKDTALIEAFNLKCAIEFILRNYEAAREALLDMPPRSESELDVVSLHNHALVNMDEDPSGGFNKLNFLLQNPPFPPEAFGNLLLLHIKYGYFDVAADILAENAHLTFKFLTEDVFEFLDAHIACQTSPEEGFRKFEELSKKHIDRLRTKTKKIQESRMGGDPDSIKNSLKEYDEALEHYIPVLMAQAKIYWDIENYPMVERIFRQSAEFTVEHDVWKLNVAHAFYMQENKFKDAIEYYEPMVSKAQNQDILAIPAMVLANLCVSYIMTSQNEEAEDLMRKIEHEEEMLLAEDPDAKVLHLCIVNLVIGTLYCSKANFEFGISRIMKSLEPYNKKLMCDTWFYAKRCFLAMAENMAKHILTVSDEIQREILEFLHQADIFGKQIYTTREQPLDTEETERKTISQEARLLKRVFLKLRGR